MACDGHYQDIKLCNAVPTVSCSSGFTIGSMGLITYVISILPSYPAGTSSGNTKFFNCVFFNWSLLSIWIYSWIFAHINICEWAATKGKEKSMICRCKKSKLNEMSPAFLAMLPFISYVYSALTTCSYMFLFFEGKENRQTHILCLACYSHYLNTYIGIIWGLLFFSWSRKQDKDFSK